MDILVDTDAIIKLAQYSLLSEFDRLLRGKGWPPPRLCTTEALYSTRIYAQLSVPNERERVTIEGTVKAFIRASKSVPIADAALAAELIHPGIDSGERILLAHLIANADSLLITGDKKCVMALATNPKVAHYCPVLASRIIHVERLICTICDQFSWTSMRKKIVACPGADIAITRALNGSFSDEQAKANLVASASELEDASAGLLKATL